MTGRAIVGVTLALGLGLGTASRVRAWHDDRTVWAEAARIAPLRPRVWVNLGRAQQLEGDFPGALQSYHRGIALSFDPHRLYGANLYARLAAETDTATVLLQMGNVQGAWNQIQTVLADPAWPNFPYAIFHRGVIEALVGQCQAARADWALAARIDGTIVPPNTQPAICRDTPPSR